jgi:phosphoribosylanthranilate isomerase
MIVQIYEVTTPVEARTLGEIGVDHIGVLVGDASFPREQTIEKAREIFAAIPAGSKASALSLSHDVDLIVRITTNCHDYPPILDELYLRKGVSLYARLDFTGRQKAVD